LPFFFSSRLSAFLLGILITKMIVLVVAPSSSFLFLLKTILSAIITVFALQFLPNKKSLERRKWQERKKKRAFARLTQKKNREGKE
jgi:purine-cytosine permease-like protein